MGTGPKRGYRPKIAARYGGPDATCMAGEFWRAGAGGLSDPAPVSPVTLAAVTQLQETAMAAGTGAGSDAPRKPPGGAMTLYGREIALSLETRE